MTVSQYRAQLAAEDEEQADKDRKADEAYEDAMEEWRADQRERF